MPVVPDLSRKKNNRFSDEDWKAAEALTFLFQKLETRLLLKTLYTFMRIFQTWNVRTYSLDM